MSPVQLRSNFNVPVMLVVFGLAGMLLPAYADSLAVVLACAGSFVLLLVYAITLGRRKLVLDERGVTMTAFGKRTMIAWDDIERYTFWSTDQNVNLGATALGALGGAVVVQVLRPSASSDNRRFTSGALMLVARDQRIIPLDDRWYRLGAILDEVFAELHARLRKHELRFDPFQLTERELRHTTHGSLALADIEHVDVSGPWMKVHKRGKRTAWASISMRDVSNSMLFLEELAERGISVRASPGLFVPPTVLDKLRAAAARQSALPQARIVER